MLRILFNPREAEAHYLKIMFVGIFYSSLSLFLSSWIFPEYSSLMMVFLTVISCIYIVQGAIRLEENKELNYKSEKWILKEHFKIIHFLLFLFIGFVISFAFWTSVLPINEVLNLFELQSSIVEGIRSMSITGKSIGDSTFFLIISNNIKVLIISLILALFYGAGAIFILAWNASVMGFVIGMLSRKTLGIVALPIAFTKYFLHGIPEMLAYLIAALAGGIIYSAIAKKDFFREGRSRRIITDVLALISISVILLVFAALIEIYISPLI